MVLGTPINASIAHRLTARCGGSLRHSFRVSHASPGSKDISCQSHLTGSLDCADRVSSSDAHSCHGTLSHSVLAAFTGRGPSAPFSKELYSLEDPFTTFRSHLPCPTLETDGHALRYQTARFLPCALPGAARFASGPFLNTQVQARDGGLNPGRARRPGGACQGRQGCEKESSAPSPTGGVGQQLNSRTTVNGRFTLDNGRPPLTGKENAYGLRNSMYPIQRIERALKTTIRKSYEGSENSPILSNLVESSNGYLLLRAGTYAYSSQLRGGGSISLDGVPALISKAPASLDYRGLRTTNGGRIACRKKTVKQQMSLSGSSAPSRSMRFRT